MAEGAETDARPSGLAGRALYSVATGLAILGGLLSCGMAALVTVSVTGRYLFARPVPGDYDIIGILCGCAIFSFYRWWTIPFDLFCMVVLVLAISYTLLQDIAHVRTAGHAAGGVDR
jgi:hypothetical protein